MEFIARYWPACLLACCLLVRLLLKSIFYFSIPPGGTGRVDKFRGKQLPPKEKNYSRLPYLKVILVMKTMNKQKRFGNTSGLETLGSITIYFFFSFALFWKLHLGKVRWKPPKWRFVYDFPFQLGDFWVPAVRFSGVYLQPINHPHATLRVAEKIEKQFELNGTCRVLIISDPHFSRRWSQLDLWKRLFFAQGKLQCVINNARFHVLNEVPQSPNSLEI